MKLLAWGKTDTGRKRDHNEDSMLINNELALYAVADGMGGHRGGATASRTALEVLQDQVSRRFKRLASDDSAVRSQTAPLRAGRSRPGTVALPRENTVVDAWHDPSAQRGELLPATQLMRDAVFRAGVAVFEAAMADSRLRGMGTTLTGLLYDDGKMHLVHAGDSRAFLFRHNQLAQLTEDHSWIWEQIKSGAMTEEEAQESRYRHVITRSVGFEREVEPDSAGIDVLPGDCFLLCSDGMSNHVENRELEQICATTWFRRLPTDLVNLANERGGDDNITILVVYIANDNT